MSLTSEYNNTVRDYCKQIAEDKDRYQQVYPSLLILRLLAETQILRCSHSPLWFSYFIRKSIIGIVTSIDVDLLRPFDFYVQL